MKDITYPFSDYMGRPSDKPKDIEAGYTDNGLLFLGELALLKSGLGELRFTDIVYMDTVLTDCRRVSGLYARHTVEFENSYPVYKNKVSHDEYNGIAFMATVAPPIIGPHLNDAIAYGEAHHWQFNDIVPFSDFFNKRNWDSIETIIGTFKKIKAYLADLKANPDNTNAVDYRHDGDIGALSTIRQPRDIAFYKIAAGKKPSLFGVLWLAIAMILSTRKSIDDGSRGGTMLMAWFRNIAIKKKLPKGLKGWILSKSIQFFNWQLKGKYGAKYPVVLITAYFDLVAENGSRNPMIYWVEKYIDKVGL